MSSIARRRPQMRQSARRSRILATVGRSLAAFERRGAGLPALLATLLCGAGGYLVPDLFPLWVGALFVAIVFEFQKRLDQGLPLMQVAALLATLQWCVGPALAFLTDLERDRYMMYVGADDYFRLALPGTAAFAFGLLAVGSSVRQRPLLKTVARENFVVIGLILTGIAFCARLVAPMAPGGLAFALHLVSQLSYVGVLYFLFSRHAYRWALIAVALLPLVKQTGESAMFHDLLLWLGLLFCFWFGLRKRAGAQKFAILAVAAFGVFTIQAVKENYRAKVWSGHEASFLGEVVAFWTATGEMKREDVLPNVITRLNQGWIISAVMRNVPAQEPHAMGETLVEAFQASLVPRFLLPGKAKSGGQENFRRFTGLALADSTSMAISPLGEAYANFGCEGGILLMLGFGLGFAGIYTFCLRWSLKRPDFLFWIPLIFYQAIKAETEFVTVLNQVSKGAVIAFGCYWVICRQAVPMLFPRKISRVNRRRRRRRTRAVPSPDLAGSGPIRESADVLPR